MIGILTLLGLLTWASAAPANMLLTGAGGGGGGSSVSVVQHVAGTQAGGACDSASACNINVSLTGVGSGNDVFVAMATCNDGSCALTDTPATSVAPTSGSCALVTGTDTFNKLASVVIYRCTGGSGSQTYTGSVACTSVCNFGQTFAVEVSGQAATTPTEGGATNSSTGTALTATSGTLTQSSGEMVLSFAFAISGVLSTPQTQLDSVWAYRNTSGCSSCTVANTYTSTVSGAWSESILGIKHL